MTRSSVYRIAGAFMIGGFCLFLFLAYFYSSSIKLDDSGECPKIWIGRKITVVGYFGSSQKVTCKYLTSSKLFCLLPFSSIPNARTKFLAAVDMAQVNTRTNFPVADGGSVGPNDRVTITGTAISEGECTIMVDKIEWSH